MLDVVRKKTVKFEELKQTNVERERPKADKNNPTYFLNKFWTP